MGKYFQNDSELLNYAVNSDTMSVDMSEQNTIPNFNTQTERILSDEDKETLSKPISSEQQSIDSKIDEIHEQNEAIKEHFIHIEKEKVKQTFKSFDELEVLERLNQITFLLVQQNSRLDKIEEFLKSSSDSLNKPNESFEDKLRESERESEIQNLKPEDISHMTPTERHIYETNNTDKPVDFTNPTDVQREISKIRNGQPPSLPDEGLIDTSVNLEEMFPDKDPEAYQAAYSSMEAAKKMNPNIGYSKSPKGGLNGSNAGF